MDTYSLIKFLHVAFVVTWIGGGVGLLLLGARANRANDTADFGNILQQVAYMAGHVFVPSALLAFLCGLIMAWIGGFFGDLWVLIGLFGFAATFGIGLAVLKPRTEKVVATIANDGVTPAVVEQGRKILGIAQFDMAMLFVVVADMVVKPAPENYSVLLIMALAIVAAAVVFLRPVFAKAIPQRA
jgi:uncharacterized membrane protein